MATAIGSKDPRRKRAQARVLGCFLLVASGLATGIAPVTTPIAAGATGHGQAESWCPGHDGRDDCNQEDGGSTAFDLTLSSTLVTAGVVVAGQAVQFSLVPHNHGPGVAGEGWSVSDQLPDGLTLTSVAGGDGYDCTGTPVRPAVVTCVARAALAPGADGAAVIVTAGVDPAARGSLRNESWVTPAAADATSTGNDALAHVDVVVTPAKPGVMVERQVAKTVRVHRDGSHDVNQILYAFRVTNTGNVPLTGVVVQDDALSRHHATVSCPSDVLAPGASEMCSASAPIRTSRAALPGSARTAPRTTP